MVRTDLHPEDLKARLRKRFGSLRAFERQYGLPALCVQAAIRRPHRQAEAVIAAALDMPAARIWPSRYDARGNRLTPQPSSNYAPARGGRL